MSSNSSDAPADSGPSIQDTTNFVLAICAFIISIVALIIAVLQALQQYFASATGYANCTEKVMGKWAAFTRRRMRWTQFRFEVEYDTPVIFVSPPTNKRGPLGSHDEKPIVFLDGTDDSYRDSHTKSQDEFDREQKASREGGSSRNVRTADNEQASWVALLMALQRMEKESRAWQDEHFFQYKPPEPAGAATSLHTLTVALQIKRKSWDSMPDGLKKPYATTNLTHLVEMLAMLGIYWREFDRTDNVYRAQGNGFSVVGRDMDELGVVFTFQKVGPTWFQENRLVPHNSCKELCFGFCPTIFREKDAVSWKYADEPKDSGTLQLGSLNEIAESLVTFGCNSRTVNYFRKRAATSRHSHLFAVPFEMLGMVGHVLQIENTAFNMLPNPTPFHWDKTSFSLRRLMKAYSKGLQEAQLNDPLLATDNKRLAAILEALAGIEKRFVDQEKANRKAVDGAAVAGNPRKSFGEKPSVPGVMTALHAAIKDCDLYLKDAARLPLVMHVLHAHLQEVLRVLNESPEPETATEAGGSPVETKAKPSTKQEPKISTTIPPEHPQRPTMEEMDTASPSLRHRLFVQLYVFWVRRSVVDAVRAEVRSEEAHAKRMAAGISPTDTLSGAIPEGRMFTASAAVDDDAAASPGADAAHRQEVNDVWCTLVFRMLCWLLLHDFHKKDVQISKSELFGSRQPVYIM